ncbi:hypothetical protein H4V97_000618 [Flavobacterium sp. CG_23.5]|nr:hypothetical protein [Flavobacterium sp. CG_9.10]MBP2282300.1 hypothetical protein [Flavobacterium sp. CG_23.5]
MSLTIPITSQINSEIIILVIEDVLFSIPMT